MGGSQSQEEIEFQTEKWRRGQGRVRQEIHGHSLQGSVCAVSALKTLQDDFNQTQPWEIAGTFPYL